MTQYRYRGINAEGTPASGSIEANSAREATARLQERGYTINSMERADGSGGLLRRSKRLGWDELSLFAEQLQSMVKSGLPMPATLKALAAGMKQPRMREALDGIERDLNAGLPLHEAIERRNDAFPRIYPALIKAGEESGNLPGVLRLLSRYTAHAAQQRQEAIAALAYPVVLLFALLGILVYFSESLFPEMREFHKGAELFGYEVARATGRHGFDYISLLSDKGVLLLFGVAGLVLLVVAVRFALNRTEGGRYRLDWLRLHTPALGRAHYLAALSRVNETLGLLLRARVPVVESLELAGAASGSAVMQRALSTAATQVAGGERIADALAGNPLFARDYCWLLANAEERGDLEEALDSLAQRYEAQSASQEKVWNMMLNSGLILVVALVVLLLFASLYVPMIIDMGPVLE